jgi:GTP-binding protein
MRHPNPRKRGRLKPSSAPAAGAGVQVPFLAIVGRPNVGKSTLFNRLMGKRISIVEKTAGTTRDRVSAILVLPSGRRVELCDMGGLGGTDDPLDKDVDRQIKAAMSHAAAVLFVVDARDGATPLDRTIAQRVLRLGKPVVLVANKAETTVLETLAAEFYALGAGEPLPISAREGTGRQDLLERLDGLFKDESADETGEGETRDLRIAIVGRRNAGKSSFVNALFGSERVIVSEMPGTTRDAVDVRCIVDGEPIVLIDTAGLRKRGKADDQIELISHGRALEAIRRCDVAIVLLDAIRDVSEVDKKICELVLSENKGLLVVANKWDLVEDRMTPEQFADYVRKKIPSITFAPVVAISCKTGFNTDVPIAVVRELHRQSLTRIGTGELNRVVHEAFMRRRRGRGRRLEGQQAHGPLRRPRGRLRARLAERPRPGLVRHRPQVPGRRVPRRRRPRPPRALGPPRPEPPLHGHDARQEARRPRRAAPRSRARRPERCRRRDAPLPPRDPLARGRREALTHGQSEGPALLLHLRLRAPAPVRGSAAARALPAL